MSIPSVKFSSSMRNKKKKSSVHPKEDSLPPRDMQLDAAQQPINRDSGGVMFLSAFPSTAASSINRHSRQYFTSSLPTLDETDSSDSENGSFDEVFNLSDADKNIAKPNRNADHVKDVATKNNTMLKVGTSSNSTSALRKATPLTGLERLQEYQRRGDDLAAIGQDAEAIVCYKKALKITRSETARIKSQLKQVDGKHPSTVQSIHSRLHEDWLAVGTSMTQIRLQMAVLQERVGDYANAIQSCQEASSVFQRQVAFLKRKKNDAAKLQETQRAAEHARTVLGRMRVAQDSFARRKTSHEEIVSLRMQPAIPDTSARLVQTIKAALAVEQKVLGLNHPQIADTMSLLSSVYQEQGDLKTALKLIRHASAINQGALGLKHPLAAEMVLQMARVLAQLGRDKEAVECYSQAISIFRESKKYPQFVGATLNEMGVVQIRFKNHIVAIASLQQALEAFQAREPLDGQTKLDIAQVYRNLGECYSALKQHKAAAESYVTTLEMQKESRAAYDAVAAGTDTSTPPVYLVDDDGIAETLRRLGKSYNMIGKRREALLALGEALLIHRNAMIKAVIPGRPSSTLPERQDQLAHTLFLIAEIREQLNEYEDALQFYEESMQLRLFSDAHRPEKRLNMVHCAMCLRGVGNIHMAKKEYEEAFKVFEDALRYCDAHGLPETHPIRLMMQQRIKESSAFKTKQLTAKEASPKQVADVVVPPKQTADKVAIPKQVVEKVVPPVPPKHVADEPASPKVFGNSVRHSSTSRIRTGQLGSPVPPSVQHQTKTEVLDKSEPSSNMKVRQFSNADRQVVPPPDETRRAMDDIMFFEKQAEHHIAQGDFVMAVETLTRLMATRKALLKILKAANKEMSEEKFTTGCTLVTFGKVLMHQGDVLNAERAFADALKLLKTCGSAREQAAIKEVHMALETMRSRR